MFIFPLLFVVEGKKIILRRFIMINTAVKNSVMKKFADNLAENYKNNLEGLDLVGLMGTGSTEKVRSAIDKIRSNALISIPEGYKVPGIILYCSYYGGSEEGDQITSVTITASNKIGEKPFKSKSTFGYNTGDIVENIAEFFGNLYEVLLLGTLANSNVEEINQLLDEVSEDVEYSVSLQAEFGGSANKIAFISDESVIFNVDFDKIFEVDDILALYDPDEDFSEEDIANAKKAIADEIIKCQTPEQLVKAHGGDFIAYFAGINKTVRGLTLIKKAVPKDAHKLTGNSDQVGYYFEDGVFAVLTKKDGQYGVVLSPFDVNTFRRVDVDVVAKMQ